MNFKKGDRIKLSKKACKDFGGHKFAAAKGTIINLSFCETGMIALINWDNNTEVFKTWHITKLELI